MTRQSSYRCHKIKTGLMHGYVRQSRFYTAVVKAERISFVFRLLTDKV